MKRSANTLPMGLLGATLLAGVGCSSSDDSPAAAPLGTPADAASPAVPPDTEGEAIDPATGPVDSPGTDPATGPVTLPTDGSTDTPTTGPVTGPAENPATGPVPGPSTDLPEGPTTAPGGDPTPTAGPGEGPTADPVPGPTGAGDFRAIAGLYDASDEVGGVVDVIYIEILPDGAYVEYDYDGDAFDQGDNCYFVFRARLESLGGNSYRAVDETGEDGGSGQLVRSGDSLTVSYVDDDDDDEDGDTSETIVEVWPVLSGVSSVDFNECQF